MAFFPLSLRSASCHQDSTLCYEIQQTRNGAVYPKLEKMTHGDEKGRVSKTDRCIRMSEGQWISSSSVFSRILGSQNNLWYYLISIKLTNQNEECFFLFFIQTAQSRLKNMKAQKNWVRSFFKFWRLFWNLLIIHVVKSQ